MEGDTILTSTEEVLESMDGCFVVLSVWSVGIGGKKCEDRCNIWASARSQPVDGSDDALVDLGAAFEVRIIVSGSWDGVNG